ncbi:MAG TPA: citryl-CoA lyase [Vicinamibacterales bacterium]|nr:citryl-CoA lyase [Vicinamibacterales bacterium]
MTRQKTSTGQPDRQRWCTALTHIAPNRIVVRGYAIDELMGRSTFGETIYLLLTGELPTRSIGRLVDAMLISFVDHGATPPSTLAARNAATTGSSLRGAVAAGVLGFGRHHGGDVLACRALLERGLSRMATGETPAEAAGVLVEQLVQAGDVPPPGFGHRYHTIDPRATRLLQLAHELDVDHAHTLLLRALEQSLCRHASLAERSLPINVDGAIAAICGDIGLSPELADALLIISRVPGLSAHALEEQLREPPMRVIDPTSHAYDGPPERRLPERRG